MLNSISFKAQRFFYTQVANSLKRQNETKLAKKLQSNFSPSYLMVEDRSLAQPCSPMYRIVIESSAFQDISKLQQHKMVIQALSDEIQNIHAVNIKTITPSSDKMPSVNI